MRIENVKIHDVLMEKEFLNACCNRRIPKQIKTAALRTVDLIRVAHCIPNSMFARKLDASEYWQGTITRHWFALFTYNDVTHTITMHKLLREKELGRIKNGGWY